ncbi:MAG TPA: hypothetical protein VKU40_12700 [Thermoanaerobaculia bacterium]|nr:hypothetical protein [Thermoanaerobaculia bacterium]
MHRNDDTRAKTKQAAALAVAYLLGIGTGLLVLGGFTIGRGFTVAGALALAAALGLMGWMRFGGRAVKPPLAAGPVAWAGAPSIGQDLPTVNDYYSNAPDGPAPNPSHSPNRRWEPLPPEGLAATADPAPVHRVVG